MTGSRLKSGRSSLQNRKDQFGNVMHCPSGTIPIRRVTLEDMSRFENLRQFLQKRPGGGAIPPRAPSPSAQPQAAAATHRWAHAFQNVANLGGHSFVNIWDPAIGANQVFSLSQHWYVGGYRIRSADGGSRLAGVPAVLRQYQTSLLYLLDGRRLQPDRLLNLSCTGFVQTNSSWTIGGAMSPWSATGGAQYELEIAYFLTGGRWWLYVKGTAGANAIGYYPVSVYKNGAMASHASEIDYGGETVGTTSFPKMGSGAFANQGWQKAAYQRQIFYYPQAGGSAWAALHRIAGLAELLHGSGRQLRGALERDAVVRRPGRQLLASCPSAAGRPGGRSCRARPCRSSAPA